MAKRKEEPSKKGLILKSIWLGIAVVFFILGLWVFLANKEDRGFGAWLGAGAICGVPVIWDMLKLIGGSAMQGLRDGANTYSATVSDTSITVQNHPIRGLILGILVGIFMTLLIGLVWLALRILLTIITIISFAVALSREKKNYKPNMNA